MPGATLRARVDEVDRILLLRWSLNPTSPARVRRLWIAVTHAGGSIATIASVGIPLVAEPWPRALTTPIAVALVLSHLIVQLLKRVAGRSRPSAATIVACPDCFSFPSGHATAAFAVTLGYAMAFPALAMVLVPLGLLIGWSRVAVGVHYP
ncbi:MAG: phosphatase PAP2 family protein, partial [Gemmatimonadales bacterium]|nr:phosphatase PAP2 family protein [Gemmatimonadales bacterium]